MTVGSGASASEYAYRHGGGFPHHEFVFPVLSRLLDGATGPILDLGCGNGSLTARVSRDRGVECVGVDSSHSGVALAQANFPDVRFLSHSISDPLPAELRDRFQCVIALELIEHLFLPAELFARAGEALQPGGKVILSTPYHGYLKNVAIAVSGKFDSHVNPTWDYGHIKFFSPATLARLAERVGWRLVSVERVGRIPPLAKTMLATLVPA